MTVNLGLHSAHITCLHATKSGRFSDFRFNISKTEIRFGVSNKQLIHNSDI
ncbi:hypothetical protein BHE74_00009470 [Ensete ventricosum]|nr:hypothetical protein BHE74_00009470 [Ensete ventricosum]